MTYALPKDIHERHVAVVGAGTLGRRIAMVFVSGGTDVRLVDPEPRQREAARAYASQAVPEFRAMLAEQDIDVTPGNLEIVETLEDAVPGAWLVIEAIPERLDIKRSLFGKLDRLADEDALLATNSSSYASRLMLDQVTHPQRVFNMHFTIPPKMMTVELMSCGHTTEGTLDALAELLPRYGLLPFIARRESTGFIFNRIWAAIKRESLAVVAEGVSSPEDVDALMQAVLGVHTGPFRLMDQVGLDVVLDIENHYASERPHLPTGPRELLQRYIDAGKLGRKSGEGFYKYTS